MSDQQTQPIGHFNYDTVPCDSCGKQTDVYHLWGREERRLRACPPCSRKWRRDITPWEEVEKELGLESASP